MPDVGRVWRLVGPRVRPTPGSSSLPSLLTCASTRRQSSERAKASCRMPLVVKSKAALVPPVESTQLQVRWRCPSW